MAFSFSACSKDDDCDPEDRDSPCYAEPSASDKLLTVKAKINGKTVSIYEYDNQDKATVISTFHPDGTRGLTTTYDYTNRDFPSTARGENKNEAIVIKEIYLP